MSYDPVPSLPPYIDSTMLSAFRSCPKKFYHEFILGLGPVLPSIDLHAGACFATAMELTYDGIWVKNLPLDLALARANIRFEKDWGDVECPPHKAKTKERMWEAVEEYFRVFPPLTDHVQPYFKEDGSPTFEFTFSIPLDPADGFPTHPSGDPFLYSGRLDALGSWAGRPVARDEKTAGALSSNWSEQWNLRGQFLGYCWALQQQGLDISTVVVRGIIIQKTQLRIVEAIKEYSQFLIDAWYEQLKRDLWRLRHCWDEGFFDQNFSDSCTSYGGCQYIDLCTSPTPERWYSNFTERRWNPVAKNPIGEDA